MAAVRPRERIVHTAPAGFRYCDRCGYLTRTSDTDHAGRCGDCAQSRQRMERGITAMRKGKH